MKQPFSLLVLIAATLFVVVSCKKKNDTETTAQKIQAKWQIVNIVSNDHFNGTDNMITYTGNAGDYFDIRSDGHIYSLSQGSLDTSSYMLLGDSKIIVDGLDTANIQGLTNNALTLYEKNIIGPSEYKEGTIHLKK
jgi:archaellum component FlaG (FlaF/FlaG flagellin family)